MIANINPETGVAYGYISANCLNQEVVNDLMHGDQASNLSHQEAWIWFKNTKKDMFIKAGYSEEDAELAAEDTIDEFSYEYEDYEPEIEGVYEGVRYKTSWLGGALNFFIFWSPFVTESARLASPCVPNAGILDTLDGHVTSYNVPHDWRYSYDNSY